MVKQIFSVRLMMAVFCAAAALLLCTSSVFAAEVEHYEPLQLHVQLEKVYMDGDVSIEHKHETVLAMEDFWAAYAGWTLVEQKKDLSFFGNKWMIFLPSAR